jgi:hypothetical protein
MGMNMACLDSLPSISVQIAITLDQNPTETLDTEKTREHMCAVGPGAGHPARGRISVG